MFIRGLRGNYAIIKLLSITEWFSKWFGKSKVG